MSGMKVPPLGGTTSVEFINMVAQAQHCLDYAQAVLGDIPFMTLGEFEEAYTSTIKLGDTSLEIVQRLGNMTLIQGDEDE